MSDGFGAAVDIEDNTIVVGASEDNEDGASSGAIYVFTRSIITGEWDLAGKLRPSDGESGRYFGVAIAIDMQTIVVGSAVLGSVQNGLYNTPAYVFAFSNTASEWEQVTTLESPPQADNFGYAVAISSGTIAISAYDPQSANGRAVYLYERDQDMQWSGPVTKLESPLKDTVGNDDFGQSVAIYEDTIVIGGPFEEAFFVFERNEPIAGAWGHVASVSSPSGPIDGPQLFYLAVAIDGSNILGVIQDNTLTSVYLFNGIYISPSYR